MAHDTLEQKWNAYLAAYGPIASEERERLLEQSVSEDIVFTNPGGSGSTRGGLITHIENLQKKIPGVYFCTDKVFAHLSELLAIWSMYKKDGTKMATGYNYVQLDEQGRFSHMAGFF